MAQLDMKLLEPAGAKRVHCHGHHFQVGLPSRGPDEFHTALSDLTTASFMLLPGAKHSLIVIKPLRQRHGLEFGRCYPGDGRGTVRPHYHDLSRAVNDLEHALLRHGIAGLQEKIVELHFRCAHLGIASALEQRGKRRLDLAPLPALRKKPVSGPLRGIDGIGQGEAPLSLIMAFVYYHATALKSRRNSSFF